MLIPRPPIGLARGDRQQTPLAGATALGDPQRTCGIPIQTARRSQACRENRRPRGLIVGRRAIVIQAQHFAVVRSSAADARRIVAIVERDIEPAVEPEPHRPCACPARERDFVEQHRAFAQNAARFAVARQAEDGLAAASFRPVQHVDEAGSGEIRVQRKRQHPACIRLGHEVVEHQRRYRFDLAIPDDSNGP